MDFSRVKLLELANLELDCKIGKDRHFIASDRKDRLRKVLGLVSVIGTALIASKALRDLFGALSVGNDDIALATSLIALLVGISTAVLGFFGLEKQVAQHRMVGNMYIEVARRARRLLHKCMVSPGHFKEDDYDDLLKQYLIANREGEACPTSKSDSNKAMNLNGMARSKVKGEIRAMDNEAMHIGGGRSRTKLGSLMSVNIRILMAGILCRCKLISLRQYVLYCRQYK